MKFSEKWLREWVNPDLSSNELSELLTMGGLEVDSISPAAGDFSGVVVARIVSAEKHPDADKLQICQVDDGSGELINIVCGASNARQGLVTALSKVGAVLPGGMKIKKAKLRGIESFGMLSSSSELGLTEKADGIMELAESAPLGQNLREYLDLDDQVIEVDLTPNRGDCFSLLGIARDLSVLTQAPMTRPTIANIEGSGRHLEVKVEHPSACPRYVGRIISSIDSSAETPIWMQERLRRSGMRSIHPIVDITNYVMLELGQPLHAFDLDKIEPGITVRNATKGEKLTLLDEQQIELDAETLVIADQQKVLALAGIMGGKDSSVSQTTQNIFLESAFFSPAVMAGKARQYRTQTDSSHRFERGVDHQLQGQAAQRATALIVEICGGEVGPVTEYYAADEFKAEEAITLRKARISRLLGHQFEEAYIQSSLEGLGMSASYDEAKQAWLVRAPSHRFDIRIEADLIEEIARVHGYNNLPTTKPRVEMTIQAQNESTIPHSRLRDIMLANGYSEAITYSFVEAKLQASIEPQLTAVTLANPISAEMGVMRTSLLTGLSKTLSYNLNRQSERVRLFEMGMIFHTEQQQIHQQNVLAGIISGDLHEQQWGLTARSVDFYDLKHDVEMLLSQVDKLENFEFRRKEVSALHPGQSAGIYKQNQLIGYLGMLNPLIQKQLDLDSETGFFQLDLAAISLGRLPSFKPLSKFPMVRRDLSLLIDKNTAVSELTRCINENANESLESLQLFDVYEGEGIDSKKKSVALGLIFRGTSSTLVEQEIDDSLSHILSELKNNVGATLRD